MIIVDKLKCIGCKACVDDCQCGDMEISGGKAFAFGNMCLKCGHCIAVCPTNAVQADFFPENDILEYNKATFDLNTDNLLNFIKFRRSVRQYAKKQVEREKIKKMIEAGRFTPTGGNRQPIKYIVVQKNIDTIRDAAIEALYDTALDYDRDKNTLTSESAQRYTTAWKEMYQSNKEGQDKLFFHAPVLIVILGDKALSANPVVDGGLAASNIELAAESMGLGVCYNGFFVFASKQEKLRKLLGIGKNTEVITSMTVGYPDVTYYRTVPRKKAEINWM